jgi:peptide chain release factor 3
MSIERARGISVVTSVMTFEYNNCVFNLLDTPGHEDFSEDTYRTLTAVDAAVMVIDGAKGIEARTRKLFEICRLRDIPIITFINKMDRETREPLDLLDEIEKGLALTVAPMVWPIGLGRAFVGTYDLNTPRVRRLDEDPAGQMVSGPDDPLFTTLLTPPQLATWRDEMELVRDLCHSFDRASFLEGHLSPVLFGSALRNFGVRDLLDTLIAHAPPPRDQQARQRVVHANEDKMSGIVFKIQANMDPNHRDRIAFLRLCSGIFRRGMKLRNVRTGRDLAVANPMFFFAQDRELAEEAVAGDVVGIPNHGTLSVGDTLSEGSDVRVSGIPNFAPEIIRRIRPVDAIKAKQLTKALNDLAEEGFTQLFRPMIGSDWLVGVVGPLQIEVLAARIASEYGVPAEFESANYETARWVGAESEAELKRFVAANRGALAEDRTGAPVYLARSAWELQRVQKEWTKIRFDVTRERV